MTKIQTTNRLVCISERNFIKTYAYDAKHVSSSKMPILLNHFFSSFHFKHEYFFIHSLSFPLLFSLSFYQYSLSYYPTCPFLISTNKTKQKQNDQTTISCPPQRGIVHVCSVDVDDAGLAVPLTSAAFGVCHAAEPGCGVGCVWCGDVRGTVSLLNFDRVLQKVPKFTREKIETIYPCRYFDQNMVAARAMLISAGDYLYLIDIEVLFCFLLLLSFFFISSFPLFFSPIFL